MTVRIPKPVLLALGALLIAGTVVGAFLLGKGEGGSKGSKGEVAVEATPPAPPSCNKREFERAVDETEVEEIGRDALSLPRGRELIDPPTSYGTSVLECADLTRDGVDEMIGALAIGASFRTSLWTILMAEDGEWAPAFIRSGFIIGDVDVSRGVVLERVPTYGIDDALCCPSGERVSRVEYRGGAYRLSSDAVGSDRGIVVSERHGPTELGRLELTEADTSDAVAAFGPPTSAYGTDLDNDAIEAGCELEWADLGLSITFANFGGADACSSGLVQAFGVEGAAAEQAEWQTADGVHVGMKANALADRYPIAEGASRNGSVALIERYSPIGGGISQKLLEAKMRDGEVYSLESFVGSAGE